MEPAKSTKITIKKKKKKRNYKTIFIYFKVIVRTMHGFTI